MQKLIQRSQIDPGSVYDGNSNGTEYLPLKPVMVNDGMRKKKIGFQILIIIWETLIGFF